MRLFELTGVKKYQKRGLWDVINDYIAAGGQWLGSGRYANVIGMPGRDYVWKFFPADRCYISFVRWAIRNPDPSLPRFMSKPRWIVPFYRRPKADAKLCIVKMERLETWTPPATIKDIYDFLERAWLDLARVERDGDTFGPDTPYPYDDESRTLRDAWARRASILAAHPELLPLARFMGRLVEAPLPCSLDIHKANIMQRRDGSLVYTDPFWPGETPYQAYDREMANQGGGDMYPDEYEDYDFATDPKMVDGGKMPKKPKARKHKPVPSFWADEDVPF